MKQIKINKDPELYIFPEMKQVDFRCECQVAGSIDGNAPSKWETGNEDWW